MFFNKPRIKKRRTHLILAVKTSNGLRYGDSWCQTFFATYFNAHRCYMVVVKKFVAAVKFNDIVVISENHSTVTGHGTVATCPLPSMYLRKRHVSVFFFFKNVLFGIWPPLNVKYKEKIYLVFFTGMYLVKFYWRAVFVTDFLRIVHVNYTLSSYFKKTFRLASKCFLQQFTGGSPVVPNLIFFFKYEKCKIFLTLATSHNT